MPQCHDHRAVVSHQRCDIGHCLPALLLVEVHPYCRQHHDIVLFTAGSQARQFGQAVIEPFDRRARMQRHRTAAHLFGWFDRDNSVPQRREARRVAAGSCADIEHAARRLRDQVHHGMVRLGERDALVALEQLGRLLGIVFRTADSNRFHRDLVHTGKLRTVTLQREGRHDTQRTRKPRGAAPPSRPLRALRVLCVKVLPFERATEPA